MDVTSIVFWKLLHTETYTTTNESSHNDKATYRSNNNNKVVSFFVWLLWLVCGRRNCKRKKIYEKPCEKTNSTNEGGGKGREKKGNN